MFKPTYRSRLVLLILLMVVTASLLNAIPTRAQGDEPYNPVIDPANFVAGVDNPYFPLVPGTKFVYEGLSDGEMEHNEVVVTHDTRDILGVTCVVVHDTVSVAGVVIEDTYDWYAQDKDGNVWYMGEDTKEYEDGEVVSTEGSWEAGVDNAKPGVIMWAAPQPGEPYYQEYYEGKPRIWLRSSA